MVRLLLAALTLFHARPSWAQFPSLRGADTRTSTPEAVMAERRKWGLDLGFGGSFNRGNVDMDYVSSSFALFRSEGRSTGYLNGSFLYNAFGNTTVTNQGRLAARYDHALAAPWKLFAFNTHAYNEFIRLDYRATTGAGPWYDASWRGTRHGLSLALAHEYERFRFGRVERAGRASFRDVSRLPLSKATELRADLYCMPKLDDFGDHHLFAEVALEALLWKDKLGLKLSWTDEYDSRPQAGVKPNESLWLTSLSLRLGE